MAHHAEALKEQGNARFKEGKYADAEALYTQAILRYSKNPLLFTNRAFARLKLEQWEDVIDDCLRSIDLMKTNVKAFFYLAQAQLAIRHPNEALSSAMTAYEQCLADPKQASSANAISMLVLKCKKAKWEARERERLRRRNALLIELEDKLESESRQEVAALDRKEAKGEIGRVEAEEERATMLENTRAKIEELRRVFAVADPENVVIREVPDYLIDNITFEIMHDPVVTKNGQSYERTSLIEHLKRNSTDPLTREPLTVDDLRPNLALKQISAEFLENNAGWAVDW